MDFEFFENKFTEKHIVNDEYYLHKYITYLINYQLDKGDEFYTEKHHILPISTFPEFKNADWNIVEIDYNCHRLVHLWLFKSINIREYQRPLNWMLSYYKNKEELSNAAKNGWIKLKSDKLKYSSWCQKKSQSMKNVSSDEQRRRALIFWNNISENEYIQFCDKMKSIWSKEKKEQKSLDMKVYYQNEDNIKRKSLEQKLRWNSLGDDFRSKFRKKMTIINRNEDKRTDAGEKIKKLWSDENYLKKMKNRKHRSGKKIKLIFPSGEEKIFETMSSIKKIYNFSLHLIRKYRDTQKKNKYSRFE